MVATRAHCIGGAVLLVAMGAVACGGTSKRSPAPTTTAPTPSEPSPDAGPEPVAEIDAAPAAESLVVMAVGDLMLGTTFPDETGGALPPDDGRELLAEVRETLASADVTFGNLEGPLLDGGESTKCPPDKQKKKKRKKRRKKRKKKKTCWAFRMPTRFGQILVDAGFDMVSIANNHALDFGVDGRESTKKTLDELGIAYSGERGVAAELTVRGRTVGMIAFTTSDHSNNVNDIETAVALVEDLAARNEIVIVSFHGGAEGRKHQHVPYGPERFYNEDRGDLRKFSHAVIDAGADLVFGHGPHVVRGMEVYNGRLVAYSLGNFATYKGVSVKGPAGISYALEARIDGEGAFLDGRIHPIRQAYKSGPKVDPDAKVVPMLRDLSTADFPDTAVDIADDGRFLPADNDRR